MGSLLAQTVAVMGMNIRSLPQRLWMSAATLIAVAIVVAVLLAFLAMANGFQKTLDNTGSENLAIIMREGSQAELNSVILRDQVKVFENAPGIVHDADGAAVSAELYVVVDAHKRSNNSKVNLPLRGLSQRSLDVREGIVITEGRLFEPGRNELVVGEAALREFAGFELGNTIRLGDAEWQVVGVFSAAGSVFGSELWADARTVQSQFNRGSTYQVLRAKLEHPGDLAAIEKFIDNDPTLNLNVKTEIEYYSEQSQGMKGLIFMGWALAIAMALGALAGALNTMYTSVSQRAKEIATLRAIGFSSVSAFFGTLAEALVLAFFGGLLGVFAAMLLFDGISASTLGSSFNQIVFDFTVTQDSVGSAVFLALIIGLVGGFFPALRAATLPVVVAFRV